MSQKENGMETCALCQQDIQSHEPRTVFHSIQAYLHKDTQVPGSNETVPCYRLLKNVSFHGIPWDPNTCPGTDAESGKLPIHNRCQAVMRRAAKRAGIAPPGAPSKKRPRQQSKASKNGKTSKAQPQKKARSDDSTSTGFCDKVRCANEELMEAREQLHTLNASTNSQSEALHLLHQLQETCHNLIGELSQSQPSDRPFKDSSAGPYTGPASYSSHSYTNSNIPGVAYPYGTSTVHGVSFAASSSYTEPLGVNSAPHSQGLYEDTGSSAAIPTIAGAPVPAPVGLKDAVDGADEDSNASNGEQPKRDVDSAHVPRSEQRFGYEPGDASASVLGFQQRQTPRVQRLGSIGSGISFGSYANQGPHFNYNGSPTAFNNQASMGDDKSLVSFGGESWMTPTGPEYQNSGLARVA